MGPRVLIIQMQPVFMPERILVQNLILILGCIYRRLPVLVLTHRMLLMLMKPIRFCGRGRTLDMIILWMALNIRMRCV